MRPQELIAGTKIKVAKATRLTSPAAPKRTYSSSIFCSASGNSVALTSLILPHRGDDQGDGGAEREGGGAERPAGVDVAHVVDVEVDPGEAGQRRQRDPPH